MRLRLLGIVLVLSAAAGRASTCRFESLKTSVTHGDYGYRFVGRPRTKDFVLEADVATTSAGPAVRVVFGFKDALNFYYAEAGDTGSGFVKVENGIEKRIGTPPQAQLPRDAELTLTVIRWRKSVRLYLDGRQVAEAYDGTLPSGAVGLGGRKDSVAIGTVRFQAVPDVRLADDFMRTDAEEHVWERVAGSWRLKKLPSAGLSANAFMFQGQADEQGQPGMALRGHWFWHDYVVRAACRPLAEEAVGLVFCYRGPQRYHLLRWEGTGGGGQLQLIRVADGKRRVLGRRAMGFTKGQWYQLAVHALGRHATAAIDGRPVLEVRDPHLVSGRVGLYCEGSQGALFDDVEVDAPRQFQESFERPVAGKWLELGGAWERRRGGLESGDEEGHLLIGSAASEARLVSGEEGWEDYTVAVDVLPPSSGDVGVVAHYQDEANYYLFRLSADSASLIRVGEGKTRELAREDCTLALGEAHRLELGVERGILTGRLDGRTLVRCCDRTLGSGRMGLYVRGDAGAGFDNLDVSFPQRPRPLFTAHDVFAAEESMEAWAVRQSDWLTVEERLGDAKVEVKWHRADFPGDVELEAELDQLGQGGRLWLLLAGDAQHAASGYAVCLQRQKNGYHLAVERQGKEVARRDLERKHTPKRCGVERVGHALVVSVDGAVVLTHEDPAPLDGYRIGYAVRGGEVAKEGVEIFSRSVLVYAFHRAPVDWRAVAGLWEVTNRWDCDPRWSFFAGERQEDPLVAMWNKRHFDDDVTLEFAAGIRHDPERGGSKYKYASDINAVVCGDGRDLRNGYNIVFGGWDNTFTRILRNGKPVAETQKHRLPRDYSQHRQWFYFKIQKRGPHVRLFVDNELALEYTDPQPLTGRRVAIWTWKNDIMVARVRISAAGHAPCELPVGPPEAKPRCCYR